MLTVKAVIEIVSSPACIKLLMANIAVFAYTMALQFLKTPFLKYIFFHFDLFCNKSTSSSKFKS